MEVRDATADDVEAIAALHADSWRRNYRGAYSDAYLDGDVFTERKAVWAGRLMESNGDAFTIVVDLDGRVIGLAHTMLDEDPTLGALLENLHVVHDWKRQGIGALLMAESARRLAQHRPLSGLYLTVLEQNTAAQGFYEARGGTRVGPKRVVRVAGGGTAAVFTYAWPVAHLARLE